MAVKVEGRGPTCEVLTLDQGVLKSEVTTRLCRKPKLWGRLSRVKALPLDLSPILANQMTMGDYLSPILRYVGLQKDSEDPPTSTVHRKTAGGARKRTVRGPSKKTGKDRP